MALDVWVFGLIPILLIALFFYLVLRIIGAVFGGLGLLLGFGERRTDAGAPDGRKARARTAAALRTGARTCSNPHCRRSNPAVARYCAQCGQRL